MRQRGVRRGRGTRHTDHRGRSRQKEKEREEKRKAAAQLRAAQFDANKHIFIGIAALVAIVAVVVAIIFGVDKMDSGAAALKA